MEFNHDHHKKAKGNLLFVFIFNLVFNIIVIVGGLLTNSIAILTDCLHDMTDTISIGLAWILEKISSKESNDSYTYGYQRFSILGAVITSVFVIIISFVVIYESIQRLLAPVSPDAGGMLVIAIIGLIFKGLSAFKLHGADTFNEKAILFHLLGDIFNWIAILIISVILIFWNVSFLDPLVSLAVSLWLIYNLGKTLYDSIGVLLQKTPKNIDLAILKSEICDINHVVNIQDIHLWSLDGIDSILTLKIEIDDSNSLMIVKKEIRDLIIKYHIVDVTIEYV